jgi:sodium pump decarboxylase gamma subunit
MTVLDQLIAGLELTITGMVTVFVLLSFMVLVIQWMSKLAHRLQPPHSLKTLKTSSETLDSTLISAIGAAIHRYRNNRR